MDTHPKAEGQPSPEAQTIAASPTPESGIKNSAETKNITKRISEYVRTKATQVKDVGGRVLHNLAKGNFEREDIPRTNDKINDIMRGKTSEDTEHAAQQPPSTETTGSTPAVNVTEHSSLPTTSRQETPHSKGEPEEPDVLPASTQQERTDKLNRLLAIAKQTDKDNALQSEAQANTHPSLTFPGQRSYFAPIEVTSQINQQAQSAQESPNAQPSTEIPTAPVQAEQTGQEPAPQEHPIAEQQPIEPTAAELAQRLVQLGDPNEEFNPPTPPILETSAALPNTNAQEIRPLEQSANPSTPAALETHSTANTMDGQPTPQDNETEAAVREAERIFAAESARSQSSSETATTLPENSQDTAENEQQEHTTQTVSLAAELVAKGLQPDIATTLSLALKNVPSLRIAGIRQAVATIGATNAQTLEATINRIISPEAAVAAIPEATTAPTPETTPTNEEPMTRTTREQYIQKLGERIAALESTLSGENTDTTKESQTETDRTTQEDSIILMILKFFRDLINALPESALGALPDTITAATNATVPA